MYSYAHLQFEAKEYKKLQLLCKIMRYLSWLQIDNMFICSCRHNMRQKKLKTTVNRLLQQLAKDDMHLDLRVHITSAPLGNAILSTQEAQLDPPLIFQAKYFSTCHHNWQYFCFVDPALPHFLSASRQTICK